MSSETVTYAKFVSDTTVDRTLPRRAQWQGRLFVGDLSKRPEILASLGFVPLEESETPHVAPAEGTHWEARYELADDGTRIVETWEQAPDPEPEPRVFSKLKVLEAAEAAGVARQLLTMLSQDELLNAKWQAAQNLREDNPAFKAGIALVSQATGLTQEQIAAALDGCVADGM